MYTSYPMHSAHWAVGTITAVHLEEVSENVLDITAENGEVLRELVAVLRLKVGVHIEHQLLESHGELALAPVRLLRK